jgi:hypothetical protein
MAEPCCRVVLAKLRARLLNGTASIEAEGYSLCSYVLHVRGIVLHRSLDRWSGAHVGFLLGAGICSYAPHGRGIAHHHSLDR